MTTKNLQLVTYHEHRHGKVVPQPSDLKTLIFSAKIDYVTFQTPGETELPELIGRPIWSRRFHGKRLTVHDATATDIVALFKLFGNAALIELEVAVDVKAVNTMGPAQRTAMHDQVMVDMFARKLDPSTGKGMCNTFRARYRHGGPKPHTRPYNVELPIPTDQQLHGGRKDAAQVKCYLKTKDNKVDLAPADWVARIEVRLGAQGLVLHGLFTLFNLMGFPFRKCLVPYFRHLNRTARAGTARGKESHSLLWAIRAQCNEYDRAHFAHSGIGAFLPGGQRETSNVKFIRDVPINNRIGQALERLEVQFRKAAQDDQLAADMQRHLDDEAEFELFLGQLMP